MQKRLIITQMLIFLAYLAVSAFVTRLLLFAPGTIGHNWDWGIPEPASFLRYIQSTAFSSWRQINLGQPVVGFDLTIGPFEYVIGALGLLGLTGDVVSKMLVLLSISLSGFLMYSLLRDILGDKETRLKKSDSDISLPANLSAGLAGFFYCLSPLMFNNLIGGAETQFFTYSLIPIAIIFARRILTKKSLPSIIGLAFALTIISASAQNLVLVSIIIVLLLFLKGLTRNNVQALAIVFLLYLPLNSYWILPTIANVAQTDANIYAGASAVSIETIRNNVPTIAQIFVGEGYFRDFFRLSIEPSISVIWTIVTSIAVAVLLGSVLLKGKESVEPIFWLMIFIVSALFATGGNSPIAQIVFWLYENVSVMALFSSPQFLITVPTFALAILIGIGSYILSLKVNNKSKKRLRNLAVPLALFFVISLWVSPFFTGDLGFSRLQYLGGGNNVANYELSPGYSQLTQIISYTNEAYRVLYLPMSGSPYYLATPFQKEGQGGDPLVLGSPKPTIVDDSYQSPNTDVVISNLASMMYSAPANASELLSILNVKYVIVRKDVRPNFGLDAGSWNYLQVNEALASSQQFRLIGNLDNLTIWQNLGYISRLYASMSLNSSNSTDSSWLDNTKLAQPDAKIVVQIQKASSTTYVINTTSSMPYYLVFSETFDQGWQAAINGSKIGNHIMVNGYANAWYINQTGTRTIVISYRPQLYVSLGLIISIGFAILLIMLLVLAILRITFIARLGKRTLLVSFIVAVILLGLIAATHILPSANNPSIPIQQSNTLLTYGLVGYWPIDETSSGTCTGSVYDQSGNNNTGECVNSPTYLTGKFGYALNFTSTSNQEVISNTNSFSIGSNSRSVFGWYLIKSNHMATENIALNVYGSCGYTAQLSFFGIASQYGTHGFEFLGCNDDFMSSIMPSYNTREFAGYSISGTSITICAGVSSLACQSGTLPHSLATPPSTKFLIGNSNLPGLVGLNGSIDDIRVYNYSVSNSVENALLSSAVSVPEQFGSSSGKTHTINFYQQHYAPTIKYTTFSEGRAAPTFSFKNIGAVHANATSLYAQTNWTEATSFAVGVVPPFSIRFFILKVHTFFSHLNLG